MKELFAATALVAIITITPAIALAAEDDSQMMQSGAPSGDLQVTNDDGSSARTQGSQLQPAGTGTTAVEDTTTAPDPAVQTYMAGESTGSMPMPMAASQENDSKAIFYIGGGIAAVAGAAGVLYAVRRKA